ncbi:hypothetical protein MCOR27_007149 [Pyricularia oryzae]|uniref:PH domain-containing protein n=1 Tax=Pyricularia grisea TaxID=148305 RepID=A0ABQ8NXH4_PYRGI|nr:hypothetical protein MCOR01_003208 [Pyricularia oryzae]KAI6303525.1 hypothetical protein MCOR33_001405 [Pyricularia grisea]KAI6252725.1 hypothetical protein MCOR19_010677 [Pyricularia oryzae]KAI6275055.1 hypothetical protein MCOR27_007149 [Pyricularia oryzae]KAI6279796.1 hypothetical protein MCOR26_004084 [Pyricularia oryzae]
MEGVLLVPPDRGTIIGRAMWKPRFVVVGLQRRWEQPSSVPGRMTMPKDNQPILPFLTIFKSKNDTEPIQQHALSSITDCQVQVIAHKKQGQVAPTLVITVASDPATDKLRKRRSSRAAGLTSSKESPGNTLYFRTGDETLSLQDWERYIQGQMQRPAGPPHVAGVPASPMSPMMSPISPTFTNPFVGGTRSRDPSDYFPRPPSGAASASQSQFIRGTGLSHKNSNQAYSSRERPITYSGSPSLRSKRSDISSHASFMNHSHHPSYTQHSGYYNAAHPADLPSPATTVPDHGVEFIEGWTAAQGRSSTLNSPIRGRDSISSQVTSPITVNAPAVSSAATIEASSPPGPRETILDRAFQMRCIPGSEKEVPGEENLSSLARFEALMREMDKKRQSREAEEDKRARQQKQHQHQPQPGASKSGWDQDDESSEDESDFEDYRRNSSDARNVSQPRGGLQRGHSYSHSLTAQSGGFAHEVDLDDDEIVIPPGAQRALDFITTGRSSPAVQSPVNMASPRSPMEYHHGYDSMIPSMNNSVSYHDPHEHSGTVAQTMYRQHEVTESTMNRTHMHQAVQQQNYPSSGTATPTDHMTSIPASLLGGLSRRNTSEKRNSASSSKRISFTEQLTRRLSSTSSLLLQTNHEKSSTGRTSHDGEANQSSYGSRSATSHPRGVIPSSHAPPGPQEREWEKKCGWRGSVVIGNEGGFL